MVSREIRWSHNCASFFLCGHGISDYQQEGNRYNLLGHAKDNHRHHRAVLQQSHNRAAQEPRYAVGAGKQPIGGRPLLRRNQAGNGSRHD
jgi:hypothetical protein